ncbi:MAG: carboxypeptidase-like regulatory domain-containing protein [Bacteroidia bacterium]|nr:carboxypeptidase-like regulatory domain-containing protein [Bacteroidia bacterium]MBT8309412.1 carboxypeptidase-like regulatory domain-containing protein [Bacteroidia bacterium]NND10155.1 hypothetical protein [Flavobacteriaceae bacterium]NNK28420.1 hypothetical protein [Flavobacteriaceae bacterium]NNL61610.1 hypothetical protein [Flavobacteriaceae bacterium]
MLRTSFKFFLFCFAFVTSSYGQSVQLNGTIYATADVDGIHVINKTKRNATITNPIGTFTIEASETDTLVFSGVQYKLHSVIVDKEMIDTKTIKVFLLENINQLDEVIVGKVLTGDLSSDVENSDVKAPINFYDVGIPGYQGKIKTQSERKLAEADHGKFFYYYGVGFAININKILNRISGRTKDLKQRVKLEARDELMFRVKAKFSEDLFKGDPLEDPLRYEFFYFCSEDPEFTEKCSSENELFAMAFLQQKLKEYKSNLKN